MKLPCTAHRHWVALTEELGICCPREGPDRDRPGSGPHHLLCEEEKRQAIRWAYLEIARLNDELRALG